MGHDPKGGRADVCVMDENGSMLLIIECKTWGRKFDIALNDTKSDGAQLFSYWQQEQACKWLVLYASNYENGIIDHKALTIDCTDDANIRFLAKKDKSIRLYSDAHTSAEKYEVWKETYALQLHDDLVFSGDSVAYRIGVKPLLKRICLISRRKIRLSTDLKKFFGTTMSVIKKMHLTALLLCSYANWLMK